jgi:hypothetical protein
VSDDGACEFCGRLGIHDMHCVRLMSPSAAYAKGRRDGLADAWDEGAQWVVNTHPAAAISTDPYANPYRREAGGDE